MRNLVSILLLSILASAQSADAPVWQVRFGTEGETALTVSYASGTFEFRNDKAVVFTIPAASITSIFHTRQQIHRSMRAYNFFEAHCCGGTDSHLLSVLAYLVAAPLGSSRTEYVEIDWTSKGPGVVQLRLPTEDYTGFMDWVSRLSGIPWLDLDHERDEALRNIEQKGSEAFHLSSLVSSSAGGDVSIQQELLALPVDSNGRTVIYLFHGPARAKNLVGILPVTEEFADNTCVHNWALVKYGRCRANQCPIEAILLRDKTYRVGSYPRTYTVNAEGLSASECAAMTSKEKSDPSDLIERKTLRRRD